MGDTETGGVVTHLTLITVKGENPAHGELEKVQHVPDWWAAEGIARCQGVEAKAGNLGTWRGNLSRSLYSLSQ